MTAMASQLTSLTTVYNRLFRRRSKKILELRVTGLCVVTGEFSAQRASNAEDTSIWWRHRETHLLGIDFFRVPVHKYVL